ncbi:hypothetical protein FDUTEX481_09139 [Tolypothrix sp. PCC 7601]|nr:hypothetical protein FDUTEX481_09139 [Tolypothrix sp. PCC 7601]
MLRRRLTHHQGLTLGRCTNTSRPHPLTPSPAGEGELNLWLPSPCGRGAGGEGETLHKSGFHDTTER